MNLGVTLKAAEKIFGPALPGPGTEDNTLSAVPYLSGTKKKLGGVRGIQQDAKFYVHFPTPIDWSLLTTKKGTPDFVSELKASGPQGEQGREALVATFMEQYGAMQAKLHAKQQKAKLAQRKAELVQYRQRLAQFAGDQEATFTVGSETLTLPFKITVDKSGKVKITASL